MNNILEQRGLVPMVKVSITGNFKLSQESLGGGNVHPVMATVLSPSSVDLTSETTLTMVG